MSTTRQELSDWFDEGVTQGATHMIVVCDTYDHEDYPVFVMPNEDVRAKESEYSGKDMQRVMEVYSLKKDKVAQMAERRAFHYD